MAWLKKNRRQTISILFCDLRSERYEKFSAGFCPASQQRPPPPQWTKLNIKRKRVGFGVESLPLTGGFKEASQGNCWIQGVPNSLFVGLTTLNE
jgi:hypothetical protein